MMKTLSLSMLVLLVLVGRSEANCEDPENDCDETTEIDDGTGDGTASFTQWTGWIGYNVSLSIELQNDTYVVNGLTSNLVGMTLGVSWTPGIWSYSSDPGSNIIYYSTTGYQNYNIIVEDIGTVATQQVTISGTYNVDTGAFTMNVQ